MALSDRQKEYYKKWDKIEQALYVRKHIPIKIFKELEKADKKGITEREQETIINNVYNQLFTSDMEVIKWDLQICKSLKR